MGYVTPEYVTLETSDHSKCEVCGEPATVTVCDYTERERNGYMERQAAGTHDFCEAHKRAAEVIKQPKEKAQ